MDLRSRAVVPAVFIAAVVTSPRAEGGRVIDVGPGHSRSSLGEVEWDTLGPGDEVRIHARAEPYREFILITSSGTADRHVRVVGVPDAQGRRPVIDGEGAVQAANLRYRADGLRRLGLVTIAGPRYAEVPEYIDIENLEIRNAHPDSRFTRADTGEQVPFEEFGTAVYVEFVKHFSLRNCVLTQSGNGLFINSKDEGISEDILIRENHIFENGIVDRYLEHNVYTQAKGIVFEFNRIGPTRVGAAGTSLKDRSAGTVIRYNWIEDGSHNLHLVETQDGRDQIATDPSYRETWVYGNVIVNGRNGATTLVQYGGDQFEYPHYRRGTLYFYNNTVVNRVDQKDRYWTALFQLPSQVEGCGCASPSTCGCVEEASERVEFHNNVVYNVSEHPDQTPTQFELVHSDWSVKVTAGVNWVSPGTLPFHQPHSSDFVGRFEGLEGSVSNDENSPGFADAGAGEFRPVADAPVTRRGRALPGWPEVAFEFRPPFSWAERAASQAIDLGAFGALPALSGPLVRTAAIHELLQGLTTNDQ